MKFGRRAPLLSVVVPVYDVADYLPACLDSLLAQTYRPLEVVVVDDGSPDDSGAIADAYAARHPEITVLHTGNYGLGAARNTGVAHARGALLGFADSDDVVPPEAYAVLARALRGREVDLATGSIVRWEDGALVEPPWMRRLHHERRTVRIEEHPEVLGDVFAWNKLYRRSFWDDHALSWPEGVRYEDQPTTTRAFLAARRFAVLPEVVYHWRIRSDGTSITQQRSSVEDLRDRWRTKQMALASVEAHGSPEVTEVFRDRVLAGDLHRYFTEIPGCPDEWWALLHEGVVALWGNRSLVHSGLPPVHRLTGWLVEQGRRSDAAAVMTYAARHPGPVPRHDTPAGAVIDVPLPDGAAPVPHEAVALRAHER
ncbi:putative glycosyltransferase EpsJ [Nocardioides dokdonensis FR1436]|uniref:Putative glycosyltransferase EpsJ n=1 Tax=Nocardioides dokdonensis FR1436 TaxID=1300347 RepID=A0A1A9GKB1_9ACTN|nr:glycosyltransferase [Nocardioides dokdonensis]ANH38110.1 putative glycosyltransferase EpsJ [Nocardioides dokdonensis FR1436]